MNPVKYIKPARLVKGDTVGIIAPASAFFFQNIKSGIQRLRQMGFKVKTSSTLFHYRKHDAQGDKEKIREIHNMFRDPKVKAIFCAKGGYGSIRLLPHLDAELIRSNPKIFMGYSDISFLLNFLVGQCGMICFHGPMVIGEISRDMPRIKETSMLAALSSRRQPRTVTHKNISVIQAGKASGILLGGCLTSMVRLLGTRYEVDTADSILFLEDVSETPTNIEEMLFQLKIAGKFDHVRGLVFGQMLNCGSQSVLVQHIVNSLSELAIPMLFGFPSGHSFSNITLPLGTRVTLDTKIPGIKIHESAVR